VIDIRPLAEGEVELVDTRLPLSRLEQPGGEYLVAWEQDEPVGHAHVDWRHEPPEVQDVFVAESRRRHGIGSALTHAAEDLARERGHAVLALEVSDADRATQALYERLGFRPTGARRRVEGTIVIRGSPMAVDTTLVTLEKSLV
jgi:GNAT superfamily N-acetyltransferase